MSKIKIDKNIEVTRALPFKPFDKFGGLCLGYLTKVSVVDVESKPEAKWEFAGHTIPRLEFEFTQYKESDTEKDRFFTHGINPVNITKSTGDPREQDKIVSSYENMWKQIKHIHDQYANTENYKPLEVEPEFDTDLSVADRLKEARTFFTNVAKEFNGTKGHSVFASTGKKDKLMVMKLIVQNNQLKFPDFVGRGFIETSSFKDGKLNTTLFFTTSETSNFDEAKSARSASPTSGSPIDSDLPDDIQALFK